jgi:hypothetical protein
MVLRRYGPYSPLGVRCHDSSSAPQELGRSRNPMSVLWRFGVLSKFPQKLACKKSRFGRIHSWRGQENFPKR